MNAMDNLIALVVKCNLTYIFYNLIAPVVAYNQVHNLL